MSRLETKFRLMRELGSVMDPIQRLFFNDAEPNPSRTKIAVVLTQYIKDMEAWLRRVRDFCEINGGILEPYYRDIHNPAHNIASLLRDHAGNLATVRQNLPHYQSQAESALRDVPADDPDVMLPPQSPFLTYLRLLAICGTTTTRLELFDPYLGAEVFDRYLPDVHPGVSVTFITEEACMRNARRREV